MLLQAAIVSIFNSLICLEFAAEHFDVCEKKHGLKGKRVDQQQEMRNMKVFMDYWKAKTASTLIEALPLQQLRFLRCKQSKNMTVIETLILTMSIMRKIPY